MSRYLLHTDGGARGNPGPAGAAIVLTDPAGHVVCSGGRFLGETTNNVAEYEALVWGLRTALEKAAVPLTVRCDSELVVRQIAGRYRVKNEALKPLHAEAVGLLSRLGDAEVVHVRREDNRDADRLANEAMDACATVGDAPQGCSGTRGQGTLFG